MGNGVAGRLLLKNMELRGTFHGCMAFILDITTRASQRMHHCREASPGKMTNNMGLAVRHGVTGVASCMLLAGSPPHASRMGMVGFAKFVTRRFTVCQCCHLPGGPMKASTTGAISLELAKWLAPQCPQDVVARALMEFDVGYSFIQFLLNKLYIYIYINMLIYVISAAAKVWRTPKGAPVVVWELCGFVVA